ncbi:MAG: penicillin acylase family protein [Bryobacteraceae bacterium]|nr:penicillin acylase family protein [Bryobacteraceae bacterium]
MRLTRVLTYFNWLIGLLVLLALAAIYYWVWRPLPTTSGGIVAPVSQAATVTRDALGVPHIRAGSVEDALFLQGYVTAQDRLWQMEALRRYSSGELSEVIGAATIETDKEARRFRMRRLAEQHAAKLPADDRKWAAAYARGVNNFIETHRGNLPLEFTLLGFEPRPWTIADSVVIGLQMYRDLTSSWRTDVARAAFIAGPNPQLGAQLFPKRTGLEFQPGSNAWALSGKHTASGKPLLVNDPHLEWGVPSAWYMLHLTAPGLNVSGVSLPGAPAVIVGHNERIAWGVTNLHFDVQDLYIERLEPRTGQYLFQGKTLQAIGERELIPVKGARPVEFTNWITRHGPVWTQSGSQALALRWTAAEPGLFHIPFVQIAMARNWEEFRAGLRRFSGPGQNFVYADVDGNIGYQATGALPVRRNFDGSVPIDGASGKFEWDGFASFEDLPTAYNPPDGRVVTANQNPFPSDWKYTVSGEFDPGYRARQIRARLSARKGWKPAELLGVQKDVYSAFLHSLAREIVRSADAKKPADQMTREAIELLRKWNGQMEKGNAAPMIAALSYQQLRTSIVDRVGTKNAVYEGSVAAAVVDRLVHAKPKEWFGDWDGEILRNLSLALEEGRRLQGRDVAKWNHGAFMSIELRNPVVSKVPYIGGWSGIGPVEMSGTSTAVKQTSKRLGPSMRFVADLSDWNKSLNNVTLGESGQVLSKHYSDQWKSYWSGESFPMRWTNVEGDILRVTPGK